MKHTPGPWTFDEVWHLIKGPNGEEVAAIHSAQTDGTDDRRVDYTTRRKNTVHANANLMTAAPEMIHALKLAQKELNKMGCECDCEDSPIHCPVCAVNAALDKAQV